ncbi:MAG: lytic transglycosylase domain-containing protein [Sideroxydans sp.]|nr:lytic transglycosylase domain-containing protein [Sideroxyarcus sp.]
MRSLGRVPVFPLVPILLWGIYLQPVRADVYAYTANDGAVNLSNVPMDSRYAVLVAEPQEQPAAPSATDPGRRSLIITNKVRYEKMVDEVASTYGVESALLHAVISVESRYSPKAVSRKGAAGLMQLMPMISKHYGVADPLDPVQNLHGGAKYLRDLLKKYNNDRSLALAAYNAGERAVAKYGNRIPPFRETTDYVPRVLGFYLKYQTGTPQPLARPQADLIKG